VSRLFKKFAFRDRALGVSSRYTYDIPLDKGPGRMFMTLLIGIMVFLAMLSLSGAFALTQFADRWQTGLEGRWTVELPAVGENGELIKRDVLREQARVIQDRLRQYNAVQEISILSDEEIRALLDPWFELSTDNSSIDLPVPALLSLSLDHGNDQTAENILQTARSVNPLARLDRHEEWLKQLLRVTDSLRATAFIFTLVICAAAIIAIAGAVQSRMAEHKESVQLLHLMGASDNYIMKQFERHGILMSLQGGLGGLFLGSALLIILVQYLSSRSVSQLPEIEFTAPFWVMVALLPVFAGLLAAVTTRWTVLRTLARMP
jgi:cell division transport system permease protein